MTAHSKGARRVVVVRRKKSPTVSRSSLPKKPPVDKGPKSYGRDKKGRYIIVRFWVYQKGKKDRWAREYKTGPYYVIDMAEPDRKVARGTNPEGYADRREAVAVAREFRDEYGAYEKWSY